MQRPAPRGWSGLPVWTQPEAQRKSSGSRLEPRTHSVCYGASGTWPHRTRVSLGTHLTAGHVLSRAFELVPSCTGHQHHAQQTWPPRQMAMVPTKDGTTRDPVHKELRHAQGCCSSGRMSLTVTLWKPWGVTRSLVFALSLGKVQGSNLLLLSGVHPGHSTTLIFSHVSCSPQPALFQPADS